MSDDTDHATVEETTLALYLLGALDEDERTTFERHLAGCDRCLAEAAELGGVTSAFGQLSDADVAELLATAEDDSTPPSGPAGPSRPPRRGDAAVGRGSGPRSRLPEQGPPRRQDDARGARRRRGRLTAWAMTVAAAVAAVVIAVVAVHGSGGTGPVRQPDLVLFASGAASQGDVSLSVAVTDDARGSTVRATVTGLRSGVRYQLYAVTRDGDTQVVHAWTGASGTQQVTDQLTEPVDSLAFFTVAQADGAPVVTASVAPGPGTSPTS